VILNTRQNKNILIKYLK